MLKLHVYTRTVYMLMWRPCAYDLFIFPCRLWIALLTHHFLCKRRVTLVFFPSFNGFFLFSRRRPRCDCVNVITGRCHCMILTIIPKIILNRFLGKIFHLTISIPWKMKQITIWVLTRIFNSHLKCGFFSMVISFNMLSGQPGFKSH